MEIKLIRSDADYEEACQRLYSLLFPEEKETDENPEIEEEIELLAVLIEHYEKKHYSLGAPDPIEAIRFRMDQMGLKQKDISLLFGGKTRVSEVLNGKRPLSIKMMILLNRYLGIPLESLIPGNKDSYLNKEEMEMVMEHPAIREYIMRNPGKT